MPAISSFIIGASVVAAGASAYGSYESTQAAKGAASAQAEQTQREQEAYQKQEALRRQAMELEARRSQREILRVQQRSRSYALATAGAQGAMYGSALPGAYGQVSGQSNTNLLGVGQGLDLGRQNFDINASLSGSRIQFAQQMGNFQSQAASGAGLSSLGGALMTVIPTFGALAKGFGSTGSSFSGYDSVGTPYNYNSYGGPR